jgi:hypothetical protein
VEGINPANIHIILERLEKSFAAEKDQKLEQGRQEHEETKRALAEVKSVANVRSAELAQAAAREEALSEQLQKLQKGEAEARERASGRKLRVERIAESMATVAFAFLGILFVGLGVLSLFSNGSLWLGVPFVVLGVLNLVTGFSGLSIKRHVRDWVGRLLSNFIE